MYGCLASASLIAAETAKDQDQPKAVVKTAASAAVIAAQASAAACEYQRQAAAVVASKASVHVSSLLY